MRSPKRELPQDPGAILHIPVLLPEVVSFLQPRCGGVYVDCTLGDGGHAEALLRHSAPDGMVIGIDRDPAALAVASARLAEFGSRLRPVHATFDRVAEVVRGEGFAAADGVLFDLGVSSRHLEEAGRGFSFLQDAPLDMRMDPTGGVTAAALVATLTQEELERLLRDYGEERFAGRIARAIVRERAQAPIERTGQLASIVAGAVPPAYRHGRIHPATRTFQALRIAVNGELDLLAAALRNGVAILHPGGRIVVISYHSLEDRITKTLFRELAGIGFPAGEAPEPLLTLLTRKPVVPGEEEVAANPRARSAKLRAAERK
ncbi:MAG: 16S rRNA (cytosine(1402)-N(4))-methyltransferase RsmH [Armatimonadetes bacterium]|nr:16S rRNA (cytosine(1402)-N(4))-methyltransferase RsmH [Armatimonadota bacterium]